MMCTAIFSKKIELSHMNTREYPKPELIRLKKKLFLQGGCHFINTIPKCRYTKLTNSVASVRERTVQTERPPLVGEDSANFCA
jgi:hypothetical protein